MSTEPAALEVRPEAKEAPAAPAPPKTAQLIVAVSAVGLFLELALIRWVSCEIRVFAYCKNLVLVASFLGFGAGCFLWRRRVDLARSSFLLLLLCMLVRLPWSVLDDYGPRQATVALSQLQGLMIFRSWQLEQAHGMLAQVLFAVGWPTAIFFAVAAVLIPYGQIAAASMSALGRPLRAYSWNVLGSLLGVVAYTLLTSAGLPPVCWFVPAVLAGYALTRQEERMAILGICLGVLIVLLPNDRPGDEEFWSSYQKVELRGNVIIVNNASHQAMRPFPDLSPGQPIPLDRMTVPYALRRPPGRVLVVGAGTGNDVSAALKAGAASVTAVEIDALIYRIGRQRHPEKPYADPRVRVVIDDARHFLKVTDETFDLVVFSHLDAHTLLSSFTNVRLDNYIYTVEAFREARRRLSPSGVLFVSYWVERPFIAERLYRNLSEAFGFAPVVLEGSQDYEVAWDWRQDCFFIANDPGLMPAVAGKTATFNSAFRTLDLSASRTVPSTDRWPFLPLEKPSIPPAILLISGSILAASLVMGLIARPRGERFDGRLFWMGAAFLLLEVHNVSRLALVFGTTWVVNAWVITAVLSVILLANAVVARAPGAPWLRTIAPAGLLLTLLLAWLIPVDAFLGWGAPGGALACVLLSAPIFFAGLIFADAFAVTPSPAFALGWNVLGSVVGGMTENLSYIWGIPALVPIAGLFYLLALLWPRPAGSASPA